MPASLVGIREKIKRADQHITNITQLVASFRQNSHCEIRHEFNSDGQRHRYFLENVSNPPIDPQFAVVVGEAVHQLRSILDHLVCQLVILKKGDDAGLGGRQWPFFTDPIVDENEAKFRGMIKGIPADAETAIEALQPYHAASPSDDPLAILAKLDNTDKHRNPLVVAAAVAMVRATSGGIHRSELLSSGPIMIALSVTCPRLENNAQIAVQISPEKMKMDIKASCEIAFADVGSTDLKPIVPCLTQLRDSVVKIVDDFDRAFFQC